MAYHSDGGITYHKKIIYRNGSKYHESTHFAQNGDTRTYGHLYYKPKKEYIQPKINGLVKYNQHVKNYKKSVRNKSVLSIVGKIFIMFMVAIFAFNIRTVVNSNYYISPSKAIDLFTERGFPESDLNIITYIQELVDQNFDDEELDAKDILKNIGGIFIIPFKLIRGTFILVKNYLVPSQYLVPKNSYNQVLTW